MIYLPLLSQTIHLAFLRDKVDSDRDSDRDSLTLSALQQEILSFAKIERTRQEIFGHIGLKYHTDNYKRHIEPLIIKELLRMTVPDKPNSKNQKYITIR